MSLPAVTESLDAVPEAARAFYVESEDGSYRLDADGVEDVSGLKSALEKERAARKALKAELDRVAETEATADNEGEARLRAALVTAEARAAILAEGGIPELLLPVLAPRLTLSDSDGEIAVTVADAEDTTARDLVLELQASPVYGRAFDNPARGGSGAPSLGAADGHEDVVALSDQTALDRNVAAIASGRVRVAR